VYRGSGTGIFRSGLLAGAEVVDHCSQCGESAFARLGPGENPPDMVIGAGVGLVGDPPAPTLRFASSPPLNAMNSNVRVSFACWPASSLEVPLPGAPVEGLPNSPDTSSATGSDLEDGSSQPPRPTGVDPFLPGARGRHAGGVRVDRTSPRLGHPSRSSKPSPAGERRGIWCEIGMASTARPRATGGIRTPNARHLKRTLASYFACYHGSRTHGGLDKLGLTPGQVWSIERIMEIPQLGGLHRRLGTRGS
jgi:hypothetical protein